MVVVFIDTDCVRNAEVRGLPDRVGDELLKVLLLASRETLALHQSSIELEDELEDAHLVSCPRHEITGRHILARAGLV